MRVDAYTGGENVPSARYRIRQHIPYLKQSGIDVVEHISRSGVYPPESHLKRPFWLLKNLTENFIATFKSYDSDVVLLQRELLSTFASYERYFKHPIIFDVDDAIHLYRQGNFTKKIAEKMDGIICGNEYLANWYSKYNQNVIIIPTAVNLSGYANENNRSEDGMVQIVWSGTSSGFDFLYSIEGAIHKVLSRYSNARLKIISDKEPLLKLINPQQVIVEKWSQEIEFSSIKQADIGIMPIFDDEWSKGKCSYKMLCYMAAGLPVVVSPYGMNKMVLNQGELGFGAITEKNWVDSLDSLVQSVGLRKQLGKEGFRIASEKYDAVVVSKSIADFIQKVNNN